MSNALLVAGRRSQTGRPLFVAGPQLGTFYPALVYEMDMHGGGIDARGASIPGAGPYVFIGRNQDFAWSLTSANNDIIDTFVETLCDGSDTKYMYKGECRDMTHVDAGVLEGNDADIPDQRLAWNETVHGPVTGYATVERRARRDLAPALDARPRGPEHAALARPELEQGQVRRGLPQGGEPARAHVQHRVRRREEDRHVLHLPLPEACSRHRSRACRRAAPASTTGAASSRRSSIRSR